MGVRYYDNLSLKDALHPQTMLAYEMNYQPLKKLHGAPLRLRVENQLGFKMVKWIAAIEFVRDKFLTTRYLRDYLSIFGQLSASAARRGAAPKRKPVRQARR